jgi:uncharacterized membrane-anchored protein YitT (DUF2179 family)
VNPRKYIKGSLISLLGGAVLAFGLYHIHAQSGVTEGGQLGLTLLLRHWWRISPALSGFIINAICYLLGWRTLGKAFLFYSGVSTISFSMIYRICEQFPPLWPEVGQYPLAAALLGAIFVGIGCGLCVRVGGAPSGDDALAMSMSRICKIKIEYVYMISDVTVLLLSLSYIPARRIAYSLLTVLLSGKLIGLVQRFGDQRKESAL